MSSRISLKLVILHFYFTAHASQDFVYPFVCVYCTVIYLFIYSAMMCVCGMLLSFVSTLYYFGFFPHEEFISPILWVFTLHGVFPWSV